MAAEYETLGVSDWVSKDAAGLGEAVLMADVEHRFRGWRSIAYEITPAFAWGAISHAEATGFSSSGYAPIVVGASKAGIPAGSTEANGLYNVAETQARKEGRSWDNIEDPLERLYAMQRDKTAQQRLAFERGEAATPNIASYAPGQDPMLPSTQDVLDTDHGFMGDVWDAAKGSSRWLMLAFDLIPEGADALARSIVQVKQGSLTPGEAFQGMVGIDQDASQLVGIPLFQYAAAAVRGERLNMGTGFFPTGEVDPGIQAELSRYDMQTEGRWNPATEEYDPTPARETFDRLRDRYGGEVPVPGPGGVDHMAGSFEEWQQLRRTAGRAALLATVQYSSRNQEALGQAYGTFDRILSEGTLAKLPGPFFGGDQKYMPVNIGRGIAGPLFEADSVPFHVLSGAVDTGKQLLDLNLIGYGLKGGRFVLNGAKKFIGQGDEMGDLIRGSSTVHDIFAGADAPARGAIIEDLGRQTVNRDAAVNAVSRLADEPLNTAKTFLDAARQQAPEVLAKRQATEVASLVSQGVDAEKAANMVGGAMSQGQIDALIRRASQGEQSATTWLTRVMSEVPEAGADDVANAIDNLTSVASREGVDLLAGRYGVGQVDDVTRQAAETQVDNLVNLLEGNKGSFVVDRAKAIKDPDLGVVLSFDADLGRAQNTLNKIFSHIDDTAAKANDQKRAASELLNARNQMDAAGATRRARKEMAGRLGVSGLVDNARKAGLNPYDMNDLARAAQEGAIRSPEAMKKQVATQLFGEHWATQRFAEEALGGGDEAAAEIRNLTRVLKRNESATHLVDHVSDIKPRLPEGELRRLLTGKGGAADMVESLRQADTIEEVEAILHGTKESMGRTIPPVLIHKFKVANTTEEVIQAFIDAGDVAKLVPQKIGLLGNYAKAGAAMTSLGVAGGEVTGAVLEAGDPNATPGDIVGAAFSGMILGGLAGSGFSGVAAGVGGGLTRSIDDMADAMDLMLAGTRSMTSDFLRARGVTMGRAQAGLSAPTQLMYGMGHTAWGRRIARSHRPAVSMNDPWDMFYTLSDMTRQFGVRKNDIVTVLTRGTGAGKQTERIIRSAFDSADEFEDALRALQGDGFQVLKRIDLDEAFSEIANLTPDNTAAGFVALRKLFDGLDNFLVAKGMDPELSRVLTQFATEAGDEFVGNVDAVGKGANYAQSVAINGTIKNLDEGARISTELWGGNIYLPRAEKVHRAVSQMDTFGRFAQTFTGAGVWGPNGSVARQLKNAFKGQDIAWNKVFDPALERNVTMRTARAITGTVWAPLVLLTRIPSFMSRVLGEDQLRMTAAGVDSIFRHPFNYISAIMANWDAFKKLGRPRGVVARSLVPSGAFDEAGNLLDDAFSKIDEWSESERIIQGLGIYPRSARKAQIFGKNSWQPIYKGEQLYKKSLAGEYRQLVADPIARRLANASTDDPVTETLEWLLKTKEGQRFYAEWATQFDTPAKAAMYGIDNPENLKAFLWDEYARLHTKTGGDWIFVFRQGDTTMGVNASADVITSGLDDLEDGYNIIRKGDQEMLDVVSTGRIGDSRVSGALNENKWDEIHEFVSRKHDSLEGKLTRAAEKGLDTSGMPQMPKAVKGSRIEQAMNESPRTRDGMFTMWEEGLDRFYDWVLGQPTNIISRQPTIGSYYWERVGLMLPSMDDVTARKFRQLAEKEGRLNDINKIARAVEEGGAARGVIGDFDLLDLNAKAYAVERTKDILFDLTRQRNFIDSTRIIAPFMGPFVEAMEAWAWVARQNPVGLWRRGTQAVQHAWSDNPLQQHTPRSERGLFWRDEEGTEMVTIPFTGQLGDWMHENLTIPDWMPLLPEVEKGDIPGGPIAARARGFNVVFGPEDLADPDQETVAGVPIAGFNPGQGPGITLPAMWLLDDADNKLARGVFEFIFPYGAPDSAVETFMPYHLRKIAQGLQIHTSAESKQDFVRGVAEQFSAMVATGLVGPGAEYDVTKAGEMERARNEAQRRAQIAALLEGAARGSLPTMITPEVFGSIEQLQAAGVDTDTLLNVSALQEFARELFSPEGADLLELEDGTKISTEGDWEVVTDYLTKEFGIDMYSAELLNVSPTNTIYPRLYTETAREWAIERKHLLSEESDIRLTAQFLMPDYAMTENVEEFDPKAREDAMARGEVEFQTIDDWTREVESRLLSKRYQEIEREAIVRFGPDDLLEGQSQDIKDQWEREQKQRAKGIYNRTVIPLSKSTQIIDELRAWGQRDWESMALAPAEQATVDAVLWYLQHEAFAASYAQSVGVDDLGLQGGSAEQIRRVDMAREELIQNVESQIMYSTSIGHDLGNFPYLWEMYLKPRLDKTEEVDPYEELAEKASPWGIALDVLREGE